MMSELVPFIRTTCKYDLLFKISCYNTAITAQLSIDQTHLTSESHCSNILSPPEHSFQNSMRCTEKNLYKQHLCNLNHTKLIRKRSWVIPEFKKRANCIKELPSQKHRKEFCKTPRIRFTSSSFRYPQMRHLDQRWLSGLSILKLKKQMLLGADCQTSEVKQK